MNRSGRRSERLHAARNLAGRGPRRIGRSTAGVGVASIAAMSLLFAGSASAATAPVNLGSDSSFSVLAGSTVTNTGPTTMSGGLGLDPGTSVTGAPQVLGATHIDDGVAIAAQNDLVTGFNDAASRPHTVLASADLSGQAFTPGVYETPSSLLFSAGAVTLNAQGDPNAVFIFQVGSSITTSSATTVLLTNGAQPCNVFWQVGASVTLGSNSTFAGTVMAQTTITANTGANLDGRLLAQTGAVNLDTNTITTSACAPGTTGGTAGRAPGGTTGTTGGPPARLAGPPRPPAGPPRPPAAAPRPPAAAPRPPAAPPRPPPSGLSTRPTSRSSRRNGAPGAWRRSAAPDGSPSSPGSAWPNGAF
jgi:hypothetical protein